MAKLHSRVLVSLEQESEIETLRQENRGLRRILELAIKSLGSESGYLDPTIALLNLETAVLPTGQARAIEDDMAEGLCGEWQKDMLMVAPEGRDTPVSWDPKHCLIQLAPEKSLHDMIPGETAKALVLTRVSGILAPISIAAAQSQPVLQYVYHGHSPKNVCVCRIYGNSVDEIMGKTSDGLYELTWSEPIDPSLIEARYGKKAAARARPDKPAIELSVKFVGNAKEEA